MANVNSDTGNGCWWRTADDFDQNGQLRPDIPTPRHRLLRELERLAFVAGHDGLDELRHKITNYRAGDLWVPVGGINKQEMDIPPVITILLTGLTASGKSSFVNLMYSVLGRAGLIPFAQIKGGESESESSCYTNTTMYLGEHNVLRSGRSGFCVYDTRGLDPTLMDEGLEDLSAWMSDGVRHNQPCYRPHDNAPPAASTCCRFIKRRVNCVMLVVDLSQIHTAFKCGDLNPLQALRDLFHFTAVNSSNENPLVILTHGDTLSGEERMNARLKLCRYLGIPEISGAYDIPCLTAAGEESDPVAAFGLAEAVYRSLLQSDRSHPPKRKLKEWIVLIVSWIMVSAAAFFAFLSSLFSRFGHHGKMKKVKIYGDTITFKN